MISAEEGTTSGVRNSVQAEEEVLATVMKSTWMLEREPCRYLVRRCLSNEEMTYCNAPREDIWDDEVSKDCLPTELDLLDSSLGLVALLKLLRLRLDRDGGR